MFETSTADGDPFVALHNLFRVFQRRNRFISRASGSDLGLAESRALIEIGGLPNITPSRLATMLNLTRPELSRTLGRLQKRKLISLKVSESDGRSRLLKLTVRGITMRDKLDAAAESSYRKIFSNFTDEEIQRLRDHLKTLNEGLNAPPSIQRTEEHPIRSELRRYTAIQGLMSRVSFSTLKINSLQWHILSEVDASKKGLTLASLSELLGVPGNTLSQSADSLERKSLIKRTKSAHDARKNLVTLTPAGTTFYQKLVASSVRRFQSALSLLSRAELDEFILLLGKSIGITPDSTLDRDNFRLEIKRHQTDQQRSELRSYYLKTSMEQGKCDSFPEVLFGIDSLCFGMHLGEKLRATLEIRSDSDKSILQNMVVDDSLEPELMSHLIHFALTHFFRLHMPTPLLLSDRKYSALLTGDFVTKETAENMLQIIKL